jgi:hypothetical protein
MTASGVGIISVESVFVMAPALLIARRHHVAPADPAISAMAARMANFVVMVLPNRFIF